MPGEIAAALTGHTLATAHRRGKFMWLETEDGPALGLHLGMAGRILVDPDDTTRWDRFTLEFADGGRLVSEISAGWAARFSTRTSPTSAQMRRRSAAMSFAV